jgi:hypothetical protein
MPVATITMRAMREVLAMMVLPLAEDAVENVMGTR